MTFGQGLIPCDNLKRRQLRVRRRRLSQVFDPHVKVGDERLVMTAISPFRFWLAGGDGEGVGKDGYRARHRPNRRAPSLAFGGRGLQVLVAPRLMMQRHVPAAPTRLSPGCVAWLGPYVIPPLMMIASGMPLTTPKPLLMPARLRWSRPPLRGWNANNATRHDGAVELRSERKNGSAGVKRTAPRAAR
jgi:hypothetical protein